MNAQFVYPEVLFLLWVVPIFILFCILLNKRREEAMKLFVAKEKINARHNSLLTHRTRFIIQLCLVTAGFIFAIVAIARPQWGEREEITIQRGRDLALCIDVSRSMLAKDVQPSRLERAKMDVIDLIKELKGDRVSIIAFRGKAEQLCPLTMDYSFALQMINELSIESAPRGETDIGDAIHKALEAFESDAGSHKAIIVISDGEDLAGKALQEAEKAAKQGITIFTVGLGSKEGSKVPDGSERSAYVTYKGKEVISKLENETLRKIAEIAGGAYIPVGQANVNLGSLYKDHLSKLALRENAETSRRRFIERYQLFLLPAVLCFLLVAFFSAGRLFIEKHYQRSIKPMQASVSIPLLVLLLTAGVLYADSSSNQLPRNYVAISNSATAINAANLQADDLAWQANGFYLQGKYQEAAELFMKAAEKAGGSLKKRYLFNAACSLYRAGKFSEAAELFKMLSSDKDLNSKAYYNLGCARWQDAINSKDNTNLPPSYFPEQLVEAGKAFQEAYRKSTKLKEAAENLVIITNLFIEASKNAFIKDALMRFGHKAPAQLLEELLKEQRTIKSELPSAITNSSPQRIKQFEALAQRQNLSREMLIPLKMNILQAARNTTNIQYLAEYIDAIHTNMDEAYEKLRNLENNAFYHISFLENAVYNLWKGMASFPQLLDEAIIRQSNALLLTTNQSAQLEAIRSEETETLSLTELFIKRFSEAVPPEGLSMVHANSNQTSATTNLTNSVSIITAEARSNILQLAGIAQMEQQEAINLINTNKLPYSIPHQKKSLESLLKIKELLPKDKNQQNKDEQNKKEEEPNKQQEQNQEQKNQQEQNNNKQEQKEEQPQQEENQPQQQKEEKPDDKKENDLTQQQISEMLNKALQREKEHKQREYQKQYVPPSPVERDW